MARLIAKFFPYHLALIFRGFSETLTTAVLVRHRRQQQLGRWRIPTRWLHRTNHSNVRFGYVNMPTCGYPRGILAIAMRGVRPQGCEGPRSDATIASDPHS